MRVARGWSFVLWMAPLAAGCSLAPAYQRPEIGAPEAWRESAEAAAAPAVEGEWWRQFEDPVLDGLVEHALAANQDLAIAAARVEEARALAGVVRADQLPQIGVGAGASRSRTTEKGSPPLPASVDPTSDRARITANFAYELDLFGRLRNATRAAQADLLASEFNREAVRLALVSDVVSNYFDLLALDAQLEIARRTEAARADNVVLLQDRFEGGLISELDLEQGRAERAAAAAASLAFERAMLQREHQIAFLLGGGPVAIERGGPLDAIDSPAAPGGLPSALLERRADVRRAEQILVGANARIGSARAALFPSIALTGYAGFDSAELSTLFVPEARVWQVAAALLQPIFNGGRNRALVRASVARQEEAALFYQQTVYGAFRDVEDALVARRIEGQRRGQQEEQVRAYGHAVELARARYENGNTSYFEVLDNQRSLFVAELALVEARQSELQAAVDLYRALGGGWEEGEIAPMPATPAASTR